MIILTIKEAEIIGFKIQDNNYTLEENEVVISQDEFDNFTTNFLKPIYKNGSIVENATQVEIDNFNKNKKEQQYIKIDKKINGLIAGSIAIILGIKGLEDKELQARKELYENLYNACKDATGSSDDIIEIKRQLFNLENSSNLNLQEYKNLVITKWESGLKALDSFKLMIEAVRTKWKLTVGDEIKFNSIEDKLNSLSEDTDPKIIPIKYQEIINL